MTLTKRNTFVKIFSFVFAFCVACALYFMPVKAQENPEFSIVNGASIRNNDNNDGIIGLKFQSTVNNAWLQANGAEKYTFGTLIYPASNDSSFVDGGAVEDNIEALDAVSIVHINDAALTSGKTFNASIVYDEEVVKSVIEQNGLEVTDELVEKILFNLYNKDFTARSYAIVGEEVIYTDGYTTSMYKVAIRTYELGVQENNESYKALALNYLGSVSESTASVTFVDDTLNGEYTANENTKVAIGNKTLVKDTDYSVNENGKIVFPADYTKLDTTENVYVINQGSLTILTATYGTDVKSVSDVFNTAVDTEVVVKGYYVGVAEDANTSATTNQILLKDTENDKAIGFNNVSNLPFADHTDFSTLTYNYGDLVVLKGTFKKNLNSHNTNKQFVTLSTTNPLTSEKTVVSTVNVVSYDFDNFVYIDSVDAFKTAFSKNTLLETYTYVRLKLTVYLEKYKSSSATAKEYLTRLHYTSTGTRLDSSYMVALRQNAMTKNLGDAWKERFDGFTKYEARDVDIYGLFTGSSSIYRQLTILEVGWLNVHDHVYDDGEQIGTCTVCGYSHYHQYEGEWQIESASTELETMVEYRNCIAKDCNKKEYRITSGSHVFDQKAIDEKFIKTPATCENSAVYYYSCECGEVGTEYFVYGNPLGHDYGDPVSDGNGNHVQTCKNDASHVITTKCTGEIPVCGQQAVCEICGGLYSGASNHNVDSYNFCRNCYSVCTDMTADVVELGIPTLLQYSEKSLNNCSWDTCYYNGKIYRASGSLDVSKATWIWAYDIENCKWIKEFVTNDTAIQRFIEIDGKLVAPGGDPTGDWSWGNYYELSEDGWRRDTSVPNGVHMFDIIEFEGKTFYGIGANYNKTPLTYTENGVDYTPVDFYDINGVKLDFSQAAQQETASRAYELFIYKDELYAYVIYKGVYGIYKFDGTNMVCVNEEPYFGIYSNNENVWCYDVEIDGVFYMIVGVVYAVNDFVDSTAYKKYTLPQNEIVTDAVYRDGKYYLLTHERTAVDGKYKTRIYETETMKEDSFVEVVSFDYEIPPLTFDKAGDDFYVSMGGKKYTTSAKNGITLKVSVE